MMGRQKGLIFVFFLTVLHQYVFVKGDLNDDVLGLIVLKADLAPPSILDSWNEEDDSPCTWRYVTCSSITGRVSKLSLEGLGLSGKIGRGLLKLQHLRVLSLSKNNISGQISPELGLIKSLRKLSLSGNSLSGPVPATLGNLTSLTSLDLSENLLSGMLPDNFFSDCLSLRSLSLARNMLQGTIPRTISKCQTLNYLNLSGNHFSDNTGFLSGVWSLQGLRALDLSYNSMSGQIPEGIYALHNLKELVLKRNHFSGAIPWDIGLCPHLNRIDLSYNFFTASIPDSLSGLKSLMFYSLSNNMLSGDFPQWIGNMTSLEHLDFSSNSLSGALPSSMDSLQALAYLRLSNNNLTGEVLSTLVHCTKLSTIQINGNSLTGSIPDGLFDLGLQVIDFSHNGLTGAIPRGSSKLYENLRSLDLSMNNLTGHIPAEIGLFSTLGYFNLSWNNLHTSIPPELGFLQYLTVLDLRNSALTGSIPEDICESGTLKIIQLDGNSLTGPIPDDIGNCTALNLLSLSHNNLSDSIPESISKLRQLKILKLESNELSGTLPLGFGNLGNLLALNISFNRLVGRLPDEGIFQSIDQSALQGNLGLCSPLLSGPCKMDVPKPLVINPNAYNGHPDRQRERNRTSESGSSHHPMFLSISVIITIIAAILIASGVVVISLLNASVRKKFSFVDTALESMFSGSSRSAGFSEGKVILFNSRSSSPEHVANPESLLNKATQIGEGSFGSVYKVPLGARGQIMAVKKLMTSSVVQSPEDFDREVRLLAKAKHPNLVPLKGYYWTTDLQFLVSEYVAGGNLQMKLHERMHAFEPLSWAERFRIIIGMSKGLAYLHHSFRPPIIHYNIKPTNILLDENNNPRISDFGLARHLIKQEKSTGNRFQSALGYMAPELECQSLRVNEKCDVYGFGVIVLELVTGRCPVEYGEESFVVLTDHVKVLLEQGNVLDCVDPLMSDYLEDEVLPVVKLALVCTSPVPSNRPSMGEVVQILQVIKAPVPRRIEML